MENPIVRTLIVLAGIPAGAAVAALLEWALPPGF